MKQSDIKSAKRILRLILLLTQDECSSVEIHSDNPDFMRGQPDCCITDRELQPAGSAVDTLKIVDRRGDTLLECLLKAVEARGLKEDITPQPNELVQKALSLMETIVCTDGIDAGVVLLSDHGSTHPVKAADGRTIQVYDNDYFSPLGDALIQLYEILEEMS